MKKIVLINFLVIKFVFGFTAYTFAEGVLENLSISGCVEVEAGVKSGFNGEDASDVVLATVEIGLDAEINEMVRASVLFLYEEDDTPFDVDEGTITIANKDKSPFYLTAGKMYVPFGNFESNMISDPLTLEIGETNEAAAIVGFEKEGFSTAFYIYNGDTMENADDDDQVEHFGVTAGYSMETDDMSIDVGTGYISSLFDSDSLGDALTEIEDEINNDTGGLGSADFLNKAEFTAGVSVYGIFSIGPVTVIAEYVGAADEYECDFTDTTGSAATMNFEPNAYGVEIGYTFDICNKETTVAAAYQWTDDLGGILPETRILTSIGIELFKSTVLALEYAHDEDYETIDSGTDDSADIMNVQLAVVF